MRERRACAARSEISFTFPRGSRPGSDVISHELSGSYIKEKLWRVCAYAPQRRKRNTERKGPEGNIVACTKSLILCLSCFRKCSIRILRHGRESKYANTYVTNEPRKTREMKFGPLNKSSLKFSPHYILFSIGRACCSRYSPRFTNGSRSEETLDRIAHFYKPVDKKSLSLSAILIDGIIM